MSNIDWKKESNNREVVPTGSYKVEITGWQECESKKGTPQVRWYAEVQEPSDHVGATLVDHTALTDKALWRIANLVKAAGVDISKAPVMEIGSSSFKKMLDLCKHRKSVWRIVLDEQYNNNKVEEYLMCEDQELIDPSGVIGESNECPF